MSNLIAYNPDDPVQAGFLAALAQGESGGSPFSPSIGTGGTNLSGATTDQFGFPQWSGFGNSHAAGTYQFQPGTWDSIASKFNLNFQNPSDQSQGAWMLAQQVYAQKTGGSLEQALANGDYQSVQNALSSTWTSVTGNQSLPQGLAAVLGSYISNAGNGAASVNPAQAGTTPASGSGSTGSGGKGGSWFSSLSPSHILGAVTDELSRIGLLILGIVVIGAALWALLAQQGIVPTPREIAKAL